MPEYSTCKEDNETLNTLSPVATPCPVESTYGTLSYYVTEIPVRLENFSMILNKRRDVNLISNEPFSIETEKTSKMYPTCWT